MEFVQTIKFVQKKAKKLLKNITTESIPMNLIMIHHPLILMKLMPLLISLMKTETFKKQWEWEDTIPKKSFKTILSKQII